MSPDPRRSGHSERFERHARPLMTEINITPFVDVMLVLLIIFIVTAPLLQSGLDVDLPKAKVDPIGTEKRDIVTIDKKGMIFFNDRPATLGELVEMTKKLPDKERETLFVAADGEVDYQRVMTVISTLKKVGISKVGLVVDPNVDLTETGK